MIIRTEATNQRLRDEVQYKRSKIIRFLGGNCDICNFSNAHILEIHHKHPLSKGGSNNFDNLNLLCPNCHRTVHSILDAKKPTEVFERELYHYIQHIDNFVSVLSDNLGILIKQNELSKKILDREMEMLREKEKEIFKKIKEIESEMERVEYGGGSLER